MAKFRQIQTNFWSNPYIQEEMTAEDKYFYLYLMTNEFTTQIGIYRITKKQIAFDLGYSLESVQALLQRFETYHNLIKYDVENREIILLKWGENNLNAGGKPIQDLVKKEIAEVRNKEFLKLMYNACPENELKKFIKTLIFVEDFNEKNNDIKEIDEPYNVSSDETYNDTVTINNKEEIINNNIEREREKVENEKINVGMLRQEITMLIGLRNIKVQQIIDLNHFSTLEKFIERVRAVFKFANENNKHEGWIIGAIRDDYKLEVYKPKPKEEYFYKSAESLEVLQ